MIAAADVVRVEGPDAQTYLQGQLSQDVAALVVGAGAWSFVLDPTGHIDAFVWVQRDAEETFSLAIDHGYGAAAEARLRKFLLRTKATITLEPSPAGPTAADEAARIAAGRISMAADIDERTVPAETGWVSQAVSFTKGCYTGQELVARMDSRVAAPPRTLARLTVSEGTAPGAPIVVDGAEVGVVTSVAGTAALGYLKRGTAHTGPAEVGGQAATRDGAVGE